MTLTYPRNDFLDPFLVALHLQERLDLLQSQVLSITQRDHFVKRTQ